MKKITAKLIRSWGPCYAPDKYYDEEWVGDVLSVVHDDHIPWSDRLWVVCRTDLLSDKLMRFFAASCARKVQHLMTDKRSLDALDVAEAFARGLATREQLFVAKEGAHVAAYAASDAANAARDACYSAHYAPRDAAKAAGHAAEDTARSAARNAANAAAYAAGYVASAAGYAASDYQQKLMTAMIIAGIESGDVK